jgi:hypothetical protein
MRFCGIRGQAVAGSGCDQGPGMHMQATPGSAGSDQHRWQVTKKEAVITQLVNKSASAELRATKMLIEMLREIERKAEPAPAEKNPSNPPTRRWFTS